MIYLSLCIPTNGISEWVFPVLDEIYKQNVDLSLFEVIVTDNGKNDDFYKHMLQYAEHHRNLIYKKTDAIMFQNQIEALKLANGEYLKFLNHRAILEEGALEWILNVIKDNIDTKPVIYFANGVIPKITLKKCTSFDNFVRGLEQYASWTTGVGIWKSDFEQIPENWKYNDISPHSDVLFWIRKDREFIIDNKIWSHEIDESHANKGKYDLYKAFGVEEISVTLNLYIQGDISEDTLKYIINRYADCIAFYYMRFNILKEPCSYDISGFNKAMGIFISKIHVLLKAYSKIPKWLAYKVYKRVFAK